MKKVFQKHMDHTYNTVYYFDVETKESHWVLPPDLKESEYEIVDKTEVDKKLTEIEERQKKIKQL